jgi:hypothetical protein
MIWTDLTPHIAPTTGVGLILGVPFNPMPDFPTFYIASPPQTLLRLLRQLQVLWIPLRGRLMIYFCCLKGDLSITRNYTAGS